MLQEVEQALDAAEEAQQNWAGLIVRRRLRYIGRIAPALCAARKQLISSIKRPNATEAEILASEVFPLADACRYTARRGRQILAPKSHSWWNAAWWMGRIGVQTLCEPWGTILILAPANYPLFLPGVQIIQALAAGNAVLVKPAPGGEAVMQTLKQCLLDAEIPADLLQILPTSIEYGEEVIAQGVDKVVLTGSIHTGRSVMRKLAESLTPATMELSGCDSVFVTSKADVERAAKCVNFALRLNGGATCIAPKRVFVTTGNKEAFCEALQRELEQTLSQAEAPKYNVPPQVLSAVRRAVEQALANGAKLFHGQLPPEPLSRASEADSMEAIVLQDVEPRMEVARADLFAPLTSIITVQDMGAAINADRLCPYSLGTAIFAPRTYAEHLAEEIDAGCVVINDLIVPTADPRVSFGGRDQSGWGMTRGPEGLREMTRPKVICTRYGNWLPHLDKEQAQALPLLGELMQLVHGGSWRTRFRAMRNVIALARGTSGTSTASTPPPKRETNSHTENTPKSENTADVEASPQANSDS